MDNSQIMGILWAVEGGDIGVEYDIGQQEGGHLSQSQYHQHSGKVW